MRRRLAALAALCAVTICLSAGAASAAVARGVVATGDVPSEASFEGKVSLGMIGPIGGIVIAIGIVGLAVGLIRHRRRATRQARTGHDQHTAQPRAAQPHPAQPPR